MPFEPILLTFRLVLNIAAIDNCDHTDIDSPSGSEHLPDNNKPSSHSVSWADPIETSSIPTLTSRHCDSSSGNDLSSFGSFSFGGDDDAFNDDNGDTGSIVISNMEMLDQAMSQFESSLGPFFFDAYEDPQDELMLLLDIRHPISDEEEAREDDEIISSDITTDPDPFDDILHDRFHPSVVINDLHGTLAIEENYEDSDAIFYECVPPMYEDIDSSLDIIAGADQFWSPSAHGLSTVHVDTIDDTDH